MTEKEQQPAMFRVLMPIDGLEDGTRTATYISRLLAAPHRTDIAVLHVIHRAPSMPAAPVRTGAGQLDIADPWEFPSAAEATQQWTVEGRAEAETILDRAKTFLERQGFRVSTHAAWGDPADRIVEVANSGEFDLVAVGSRGAGRVRGILVGSVSDRVVHRSSIPVVVVR